MSFLILKTLSLLRKLQKFSFSSSGEMWDFLESKCTITKFPPGIDARNTFPLHAKVFYEIHQVLL
jgi:hypothetical protein